MGGIATDAEKSDFRGDCRRNLGQNVSSLLRLSGIRDGILRKHARGLGKYVKASPGRIHPIRADRRLPEGLITDFLSLRPARRSLATASSGAWGPSEPLRAFALSSPVTFSRWTPNATDATDGAPKLSMY